MTKKEALLAKFLKVFPLALALPRANECLVFGNKLLKRPVLDLGCGDGVFAKFCFRQKIDVGLDANQKEVTLADQNRVYQKAVVGLAAKMPFKDGSFQTVLANSSLEHIKDLEPTLKEINRVLRNGGCLMLTVPRPVIADCLFFPKVFNKLKLGWLARLYIDLKQRFWRHYNLLEEADWQKHLVKAGFKVKKSLTLIPRKVVTLHDIFYPLGLPYALSKRFFKGKLFFRPNWLARFLAKKLTQYCQVFEDNQGTTLYLEAVKVSTS